MLKNFKLEKEKKDFHRDKSKEKYGNVIKSKKHLDQNYELKMKELARRVKMKECHGTKLSPEALRLRQKRSLQIGEGDLGDIRLEDVDSEEPEEIYQNRDMIDSMAITTA